MHFPSLLPIILEGIHPLPIESAVHQYSRCFTPRGQNLKDTFRSTIAIYEHMSLFVVTPNR